MERAGGVPEILKKVDGLLLAMSLLGLGTQCTTALWRPHFSMSFLLSGAGRCSI
jgi:hypothetical protein